MRLEVLGEAGDDGRRSIVLRVGESVASDNTPNPPYYVGVFRLAWSRHVGWLYLAYVSRCVHALTEFQTARFKGKDDNYEVEILSSSKVTDSSMGGKKPV